MSALGHFLEDEGLATTIISLVRLHSEKTAPPRSLWVKFELGRPLGPPNDPGMQRRVLTAALELLESEDGPSLILDFDHDDAGTAADDAWTNPVQVPDPDIDLADAENARVKLVAELAAVAPYYKLAQEKRGRTTAGVSGLGFDEIAAHVTSFLGSNPAESPRADMSPAMLLRFAADDLKAGYMEAAAAGPGRPSSMQLGNWFWRETVAGKILIALRAAALVSEDKRFKTVGGAFLVPRVWIAELGL